MNGYGIFIDKDEYGLLLAIACCFFLSHFSYSWNLLFLLAEAFFCPRDKALTTIVNRIVYQMCKKEEEMSQSGTKMISEILYVLPPKSVWVPFDFGKNSYRYICIQDLTR